MLSKFIKKSTIDALVTGSVLQAIKVDDPDYWTLSESIEIGEIVWKQGWNSRFLQRMPCSSLSCSQESIGAISQIRIHWGIVRI